VNVEYVLRIILLDCRERSSVGILPGRLLNGYPLLLLSRHKSALPACVVLAGSSFFSAKSAYPLEIVFCEVSIRYVWVICPLFFLNLIESGF